MIGQPGSGAEWHLEIADSGSGISEAAIPGLFERFYRVDRGRAREESGTGLGLAILKHAIKMQGRGIDVESELGRGTKFTVELPLEQASSSGQVDLATK